MPVKTKFACPINPNRDQIDKLSKSFTTNDLTTEFIAEWKAQAESRNGFYDLPESYNQVQEACDTASNQAQWNLLLYQFVGGLSNPSKMPCFSWSIPAQFCHTGSKLFQERNTTCSSCYALKGYYVIKSARNAMARRLATFNNSGGGIYNTFTLVLSKFLNWKQSNSSKGIDSNYFRWFDSGDIQDYFMLSQMVQIAHNCPSIKFWLPTRELSIIGLTKTPDNLIIRYSTPLIDTLSKRPNSTMVFSSLNVLPEGCSACPATTTDKPTCDAHNCRACWNSGHIGYHIH